MSDKAKSIAALNDALRKNQTDRTLGKIYITDGIRALGPALVTRVISAVAAFDDFNADNDPNHEHDFGSLEIESNCVFFKIDYFDRGDPDLGADDPSDPATTERALTIMLAEEY